MSRFSPSDDQASEVCDCILDGMSPREICKEMGITRRTFNMWISHALFCPKPTEAQSMLKDCIFHFLAEWWHEEYSKSQKQG